LGALVGYQELCTATESRLWGYEQVGRVVPGATASLKSSLERLHQPDREANVRTTLEKIGSVFQSLVTLSRLAVFPGSNTPDSYQEIQRVLSQFVEHQKAALEVTIKDQQAIQENLEKEIDALERRSPKTPESCGISALSPESFDRERHWLACPEASKMTERLQIVKTRKVYGQVLSEHNAFLQRQGDHYRALGEKVEAVLRGMGELLGEHQMDPKPASASREEHSEGICLKKPWLN
jgi:hypothetical protein